MLAWPDKVFGLVFVFWQVFVDIMIFDRGFDRIFVGYIQYIAYYSAEALIFSGICKRNWVCPLRACSCTSHKSIIPQAGLENLDNGKKVVHRLESIISVRDL